MIKRPPVNQYFLNQKALEKSGLNFSILCNGIKYVYRSIDKIESALLEQGSPGLSKIGELSVLSSIIGSFFTTGIVKSSKGVFKKSDPNKYQDLRSDKFRNIEVKMSIEKNKPKAHLPKPGNYLTCRYILGDKHGKYLPNKRGNFVWIWEIRFGYLSSKHFNVSNTKNDSGKTAVVNSEGMKKLIPVFFSELHCPYKLKKV